MAEARKKSLYVDPRTRMPKIEALGRKLSPHEDFYHWILTLSWTQFFVAVAIGFTLVNAIFAALYSIQEGCIAQAPTFADRFFFSVQTIGTIGYGGMAPATRAGNVIVAVEALVGLLFTALVTGLTFARFARPTARILFAEKAVIGPRDGVPHLMFRLANYRRNQIVEAQLHVLILVTETTREGDTIRRPQTLPLVRSQNPMFALTWTAMHRIDASSPFHGEDAFEKLRQHGGELYLSVSGLDETISQTIHARYRYQLEDIVPNARFADVLTLKEDGTRIIDYDKFHDVVTFEGDRP